MIPALPIAPYPDPLRDPTSASAVFARSGGGAPTVQRVDAVRRNLRGHSWAAERERPESRAGARHQERRETAGRADREEILRDPWATPKSLWDATLLLAQRLGQLDDAPARGLGAGPAEDSASGTPRPAYNGPDPHGFGSAAYRRVGAEPPLYREGPVVFRLSV